MSTTPLSYQQSTSYDRYAMEPHFMDWQHQPVPYKHYPGIYPVTLPEIESLFKKSLKDASDPDTIQPKNTGLDLKTLSTILLLANGLTGKTRQSGIDFYYRSAPSAGALYPNEIYLVWPGDASLEPGIFHYGVNNRSLTPLRKGDYLPAIQSVDEKWMPASSAALSAVFIITGIFFKSAWKYRKRAYRYVLMDGGHVMESLRLAISAADFPCRLQYDFDDEKINHLLGVDPGREVSIGCVCVNGKGKADVQAEASLPPLPDSIRAASRTSDREINYTEIDDIHEAGKKIITASAADDDMVAHLGISISGWQPIPPKDDLKEAPHDYVTSVFKRRSRRNFISVPMTRGQFDYLLNLVCLSSEKNIYGSPHHSSSVCTGFLAGNINGVEPGFYLLDTRKRQFGRIFKGNVLEKMTSICLDQAWLALAGIHFVFMTNFEEATRRWGSRGYRYAMMTAGRLGHAVYLGATAQGLGCCGIGAFYDNEAKDLLGLNSESAMLYLVAAGSVRSFG